MGKGDYLKYSKEEIYEKLNKKGYSWIEGEYKNRNSKIVVEENGYKAVVSVGIIMKGQGAKFFFSKNPYTIDNIKLWLKRNSEYSLVSTEYIGANEPLILYCSKHGEFEITWNKLLQGRGCQKCSNRNKKYTLQEIKELLSEINPNIEILSKEYKDCFTKLTVKCKIDGNVWNVTWHNLLANGNGCPECKRQSFKGENNHRYNPNLTDEEREIKRNYEEYPIWRECVYKRDGYSCQICNSSKSGELVAHHKNGWNWCKEQRFDVNNGVTLCSDCHKDFHNIYGYGDNTEEQFEEWSNKLNKNKSV